MRNNSLLSVLILSVWLILLFLCLVIGYVIVPMQLGGIIGFIGYLQIISSFILVCLWLIGWYKSLDRLLYKVLLN
ncbi:MAG: hypothetical protein OEY49_04165 [Candidatus Heimdallarchaeota archaeon]|nr:hypothetical protein [Candidatus Heimdallarchaeota archaeon]